MSNHQAVLAEIEKINKELENLNKNRLYWQHCKDSDITAKNRVVTTVLGVATVAVIAFLGWNVFEASPVIDTYTSKHTSVSPVVEVKNKQSAPSLIPEPVNPKAEKMSSIIRAEVKERCPESRGHNASSNDRGEIVVNVICPQFDAKGNLVSTKQITWTSEASLIFKN